MGQLAVLGSEAMLNMACEQLGHGPSFIAAAYDGKLAEDVVNKITTGVLEGSQVPAELVEELRRRSLFQPRSPALMRILAARAREYISKRWVTAPPATITKWVSESVTLAMRAQDLEFEAMQLLKGSEAEKLNRVSEFAARGKMSKWDWLDRFCYSFGRQKNNLWTVVSPPH